MRGRAPERVATNWRERCLILFPMSQGSSASLLLFLSGSASAFSRSTPCLQSDQIMITGTGLWIYCIEQLAIAIH
jgi:hypothetical protein